MLWTLWRGQQQVFNFTFKNDSGNVNALNIFTDTIFLSGGSGTGYFFPIYLLSA